MDTVNRGVLLFNLGGPEAIRDVRPFLYNLFSDPEIIRIKNGVLRRLLARLIASARHKKSENLYRQIGGGSPLRKITEDQAAALEGELHSAGFPARVYVGMRCWKPGIDEAVKRILQDCVTELVLLPLFPQYSMTTTGSCLKYFSHLQEQYGLRERMAIRTVDSWFDEPLYIESVADAIREAAARFPPGASDSVHLLYSAHSIPERYVREGDPYLEQTRKTVALIDARLGNAYPSNLAFQSRVGPVKWLEPSTKDVLAAMGKQGIEKVLVVPVSFVSDHIETLQEIDIAYRDLALKSGIREFHRADAPNLNPKFIAALAKICLGARPR